MERIDRESNQMMEKAREVEQDLRAGKLTIPQARKAVEPFIEGMDFFSVQMDMLEASGDLLAVRDLYRDAMKQRSQGMEAYRDYFDHWDAPFGKQAETYFGEADKKIKEAKDRLDVIRKSMGL